MSRRVRFLPAAALAAAVLLPAAGRAEPTHITFPEAVKIALEKNSTLQRAENDLVLDRNAVSGARMQYVPDLGLSASGSENFGRTFSESEGRILSTTNRSFSTRLSASVTLFDGFARGAALKAALLDLEAGGRDAERARQTVVFLVISGYLSVIEADAQRLVAEENLSAQQDQEQVVRTLVDAGKSPISDLYQQQANVARGELNLVSAKRTLELARIDLVQTLGLDPTLDYLFDAPALPDSVEPGPEPALADLLDRAFEHRSDLAALESRFDASLQGERVASSGHWPTLSLSGGYGSSYSSGSDRDFLQQLDDRRGGSVGLGLSFPIFDRLDTKRSIERAKVATDNARIALSDRRQQVALEVRRAVLDELSARESLNAAAAQLRAATLELSTTQQRYEAGASTLHEVTLARASLVEARSSRISAAYTLLWQRHVRDYYVGVLDPESPLLP